MSENVPLSSEQGKQQIDALMAKMSPEQQAEFKVALASDKPVHVHVDKEGKVVFGEAADAAAPPAATAAPENVTELKKEEPRKPNKMDQKRQQIFVDRIKRHMGNGLTQDQALQAVQREDYERMPVEKKLARLETMISQSFQRLGQEVMHLSQEHMAIGDAFDINYRSIQKMFIKLGLSAEDQKVLIEEAQKETIELRKKQVADMEMAELNQRRAEQEAAEQKRVEAEMAKPKNAVIDGGAQAAPEAGAAIPPEATVFGG